MRPPMLIALAVVVAVSGWMATQEDEGAVEAVSRADGGSALRSHAQSTSAAKGRPQMPARKPDQGQADLLVSSVAQWQRRTGLAPWPADQGTPWDSQRPPPPPPPPVVAVEPPPPMAPPFPHAWVGRFNDTALRAVVAGADKTWVVAVGDVIEGQWRIDQIQERQLDLTYLPLQQQQTIAMKAP